jgi:DNA polymerase-3 subunit beta
MTTTTKSTTKEATATKAPVKPKAEVKKATATKAPVKPKAEVKKATATKAPVKPKAEVKEAEVKKAPVKSKAPTHKNVEKPYVIEIKNSVLSDLIKQADVKARNPVLPILEDILFQVKGNELKAMTTDLELSKVVSTTFFKKQDERDFKVMYPKRINLKPFSDLLTISFQIVELTRGADVSTYVHVSVTDGVNTINMKTDDALDYPILPKLGTEKSVDILHGEDLKELKKLIAYTSDDELRASMTGIYFNAKNNRIEATDAHKLKWYDKQMKGSFILPSATAKHITSSFSHSCTIKLYDKNVVCSDNDTVIVSKIIDAKYPEIQAVIPSEDMFTSIVSFDKSEMVNALNIALQTVNTTTNKVELDLTENSITISSEDIDCCISSSIKVYANVGKGEAATRKENPEPQCMRIAFNGKFLLSILNDLNEDVAVLKLCAANKATIVNDRILIMPILLSK